MEFEALQVTITRDDENESYHVAALDENQNTRSFEATALNLNGFAFATSGMEISEHDERVIVQRETEGGYLNLQVQPSE